MLLIPWAVPSGLLLIWITETACIPGTSSAIWHYLSSIQILKDYSVSNASSWFIPDSNSDSPQPPNSNLPKTIQHRFRRHFQALGFGNDDGFRCPTSSKGSADKVTRNYPFCVGKRTLEEYQNNLPGHALLEDILTFEGSKLQDVPVAVTNNPSQGFKNVKQVEYSIMRFFPDSGRYHTMYSWIHVKIITKKPVKVLLVQANVLPYAMPYGNFDIEFACADCHDASLRRQFGNSLKHEDQLGFADRRAAVIPCFRRTHLHITHPDIYVFASDKPQSEFHFHYRLYDVTCRETKHIQFMIANKQVDGTLEAFYTALIDHEHVHRIIRCHELPIHFSIPKNGNWYMAVYPEYEACLKESEKNCNYKEDSDTYQSDYVCSGKKFTIQRTLCPFDESVLPGDCYGFDTASGTFNQCGKSGEVCGKCNIYENPWQDELFRRLVRRTYAQRRFHGLFMILGTIGLANISIHIARYFKEIEGGIILVGWWAWAHFGLALISVFLLWLAVAVIIQIPRRGYHIHEKFRPNQLVEKYYEERDRVITLHYIVGILTFVLFHAIVAFGAVRPSAGLSFWIFSHAFIGYLTVILGALSTWISTACLEAKIWTGVLLVIAIGPWVAAHIIQVNRDRRTRSDRKYFPVIEAIGIVRPMPDGPLRVTILGLLTFLTYVFLVIAAVKSDYTGLLVYAPCKNCPYKYDELVLHTFESPVSSTLLMLDKYKCEDEPYYPGVFK